MKKFILLLSIIFTFAFPVFSQEINQVDIVSYGDGKNHFGLKYRDGEVITPTLYNKLIRLGDKGWIFQKGNKFGIIDNNGDIIVRNKYRHAERFLGKYAKLGNNNDYGVWDESGNVILPPVFSKVDLLGGKMFLTCKNFKYGVGDLDGNILLSNIFDDIYMPDRTTLRVKYDGEWFEIKKVSSEALKNSEDDLLVTINENDYEITFLANTAMVSGYSALTATDYLMKLISSISPSYEDTIDELMLSHGTDSVSIIMKLGWIPKFPVTYAQKYYHNFINPNNGPLSDAKDNLKKQMK